MLRRSDIENEIKFLEENTRSIETELESLRKKVPEVAKLHSTRHNNGYQYFMRTNSSDTNGEYIKVKDRKRAIILAQIEYYEKLLEKIKTLEEQLAEARSGKETKGNVDEVIVKKEEELNKE